VGLKVEPDFGGPLEVTGKAQRGVSGDGSFALHDFVNPARGHADVFRNAVFGQAKGQNKILAENFTGMNGGVLFHG
jgi:hypothetical protein